MRSKRPQLRTLVRSLVPSSTNLHVLMESTELEAPLRPTEAIVNFIRLVATNHSSTGGDFLRLMESLIMLEGHPMSAYILNELFYLRISPSFFNSSIFSECLQRAFTEFLVQVNAGDFICSNFLRPLLSAKANETVYNQSLFRDAGQVPLVAGLACYNWKEETIYSVSIRMVFPLRPLTLEDRSDHFSRETRKKSSCRLSSLALTLLESQRRSSLLI